MWEKHDVDLGHIPRAAGHCLSPARYRHLADTVTESSVIQPRVRAVASRWWGNMVRPVNAKGMNPLLPFIGCEYHYGG